MPLRQWPGSQAKAEFDLLAPPRHSRFAARPGTESDLAAVYSLIARHVPPPYAPAETLGRALAHNRDVLLVFCRGDVLLGFHAALYLNALGLERLLLGEFDALDPDPAALAPSDQGTAAIYHWLTICPGLAVEGLLHLSQQLRRPALARANLFSRPVTPDGERRLLGFGYRRIDCGTPNLHRYVRLPNRVGAPAQAAA